MSQYEALENGITLAQDACGLEWTKPATADSLEAFRALTPVEQIVTFVPDLLVATLPHEDCGDALVDLSDYLEAHTSSILLRTQSTPYGASSGTIKLRTHVADRLLDAEKHLQNLPGKHSLTFAITDGHRPLSVQRTYFENIKRELREKEGLEGEALYNRAHMLIADPDHFPPHTTGGAVDLTITDLATGKDVDMGTAIDVMDDARIFPFHAELSADQLDNRCLLYGIMIAAGFVGFPGEWWHFSYGDKEWALRGGHPKAIFTPIDE